TGIFAALLIGCCVGPIVLMGIVYDPAYRGPIDAGDLGKCVSIFHVLAIVFAGTHTATEINAGSTALSFLTQKSRWEIGRASCRERGWLVRGARSLKK